MTGIFMESIVMAFMIGAIVGAITALHLSGALVSRKTEKTSMETDDLEKIPVRIKNDHSRRR